MHGKAEELGKSREQFLISEPCTIHFDNKVIYLLRLESDVLINLCELYLILCIYMYTSIKCIRLIMIRRRVRCSRGKGGWQSFFSSGMFQGSTIWHLVQVT